MSYGKKCYGISVYKTTVHGVIGMNSCAIEASSRGPAVASLPVRQPPWADGRCSSSLPLRLPKMKAVVELVDAGSKISACGLKLARKALPPLA